jgi:excinuclease ABC subunit A
MRSLWGIAPEAETGWEMSRKFGILTGLPRSTSLTANRSSVVALHPAPRTGELIRIRGARTHNLKNINLDLPRNRLIVITGLSGSG